MHAWGKAFQFSVIHVFTYLPFFRKSSGKKLHWTSNSTGDVLRRLFHITPGVGAWGSISWHFQCKALRLEMKNQPRTFLLSEKQGDTTKAPGLCCCFGLGLYLCMCVYVCFGSCLAERGKFRCTCWWEHRDGECFQSATGSVWKERCLSCKRLWAQ